MLTAHIDKLSEEIIGIRVERDGALIGRCQLFTAVHWDDWWIAEEERGKASVLRALIQASLRVLTAAGLDTVYTGVEDSRPDVAALLTKFGFDAAPGRLFLLKVDRAALTLKD